MKNAYAISSLARQLGKLSEKMDSLAMGIQDTEQNAPDVSVVYQGLLTDEIEHLQILTLELTKLVFGAAANADEGGDGGVFAAGDLTDEKAGESDNGNGGEGEGRK